MRITLLPALLLLLPCTVLSFPMCTDGEPPLMESNDAFPCNRGCPMGFQCEFQDSHLTASVGICCANTTALRLIYGDDNENHVDPIWDLEGVTSSTIHLQAPDVQGPPTVPVYSSPLAARRLPSPPAFGPPKGHPMTKAQTITSEEESTATQAKVVTIAPAEASTELILASEPEATATSSVPPEVATEATVEEKTAESTSAPVDTEKQEKESESDTVQGAVAAPEPTTIASETIPEPEQLEIKETKIAPKDTETALVEVEDVAEPIPNVEPTPSIIEQTVSAELTVENATAETLKETAVEEGKEPDMDKESSNSSTTTAHIETAPVEVTSEEIPAASDEISTTAASVETTEATTIQSASVMAEADVISPTSEAEKVEARAEEKEIPEGADTQTKSEEKGEEQQMNYSCQRQKYRFSCRSGSVKTQPTLRWWWNEEKKECEFYPWGYCPGDRVVHSTTIRTKLDCEQHCSAEQGEQKQHRQTLLAIGDRKTENNENKVKEGIESIGGRMIGIPNEKIIEEVSVTDATTVVPQLAIADPASESASETAAKPLVTEIGSTVAENTGELAITDPASESSSAHENELAPVKTEEKPEGDAAHSTKNSENSSSEEKIDSHLEEKPSAEESAPKLSSGAGLAITDPASESASENNAGVLPEPALSRPIGYDQSETGSAPSEKEAESKENEEQPSLMIFDRNNAHIKEIGAVASTNEVEPEEKKSEAGTNELAEGSEKPDGLTEEGYTELEKTQESHVGIIDGAGPPKQDVMCARTSYRHLCLSGMPSQFVYRWELLDGKCQSFPYGYCFGGFNHAHPRSFAECEEYCMIEDVSNDVSARLL